MILSIIITLVIGAVFFLAERFMLQNDRGSRERKHILMAIGFGLVALLLAGFLEGVLSEIFHLPSQIEQIGSADIGSILFLSIMVGIVEEGSKFLPLADFINRKPFFNEVTDGVIYFSATGLVFGMVENVFYIFGSGGGAGVGLLRLVVGLFLHGALTGIVGYYFARAHVLGKDKSSSWYALAAVMLVHAVYDFGMFSGGSRVLVSFILSVCASCYLFWFYYKASLIDEQVRNGLVHSPLYVPASSVAAPPPIPQATPAPTAVSEPPVPPPTNPIPPPTTQTT